MSKELSFYQACAQGDLDAVECYLNGTASSTAPDINQTYVESYPLDSQVTALRIACINGHVQVVSRLLEIDSIQIPNGVSGKSLLSELTSADMLRFLLQHPRTCAYAIQTVKYNERNISLLAYYGCQGHIELVKVLLELGFGKKLAPASYVQGQYYDRPALIYTFGASAKGVEIIKLLFQYTPDILSYTLSPYDEHNLVDESCKLPGRNHYLKAFLEADHVQLRRHFTENKNPLLLASKNKNWENVELLLSNPDIKIDSEVFLYVATKAEQDKDYSLLQKLIDHPKFTFDIFQYTNYGTLSYTPLTWACEKNYIKIVGMLLASKKCDVDLGHSRGGYNHTPLTIIVEKNRTEIAKLLLLEKIKNINPPHGNETLFSYLCYRGYHEIVAILIQDPRIDLKTEYTNNCGNEKHYVQTVRDIAEQHGHSKILKLIIDVQDTPRLIQQLNALLSYFDDKAARWSSLDREDQSDVLAEWAHFNDKILSPPNQFGGKLFPRIDNEIVKAAPSPFRVSKIFDTRYADLIEALSIGAYNRLTISTEGVGELFSRKSILATLFSSKTVSAAPIPFSLGDSLSSTFSSFLSLVSSSAAEEAGAGETSGPPSLAAEDKSGPSNTFRMEQFPPAVKQRDDKSPE